MSRRPSAHPEALQRRHRGLARTRTATVTAAVAAGGVTLAVAGGLAIARPATTADAPGPSSDRAPADGGLPADGGAPADGRSGPGGQGATTPDGGSGLQPAQGPPVATSRGS